MERVQGVDRYFLYCEDVDLGLRIRKTGWPLGYIPEARIIHLEGQSERETPPAAVFEKKLRGELLFYEKQYTSVVVRRIKRIRRIEAQWRIVCLWLAALFVRENEQRRAKWIKYTVAERLYR
jgi:Predicted glycosyltransferases